MSKIKLKSINFDVPAFRKLEKMTIQFAERITLIAGHNGIGKSTILGLVSNGSGINDASIQSYLNRTFDANLNEIVHLDYEQEFLYYKNNDIPHPAPTIEYNIDNEKLIKRCSITQRSREKQIRVVPRTEQNPTIKTTLNQSDLFSNLSDHIENNTQLFVGQDAKVPLPTLYLGMTRMIPVGESNPAWIKSETDSLIDVSDAKFIKEFIDKIIYRGTTKSNGTITNQSIKGTKKTAKHPDYSYSPKCISLGQDSLSAIATALASFNKIKREMGEAYPGGLLVIDELDAGFHPKAQKLLMEAIANSAKKLDLQIIATTHSLCLIETIHPDSNPRKMPGKIVDTVIYLTDTIKPSLAENYTLEEIRADMNLVPPTIEKQTRKQTPELKAYFEDPEAEIFFKEILTTKLKARIKNETCINLKTIPIYLGCDQLKSLPKHDKYFLSTIIILDADSEIDSKHPKNMVNLPGGLSEKGKGLNPEQTLYRFIEALSKHDSTYQHSLEKLRLQKISSDQINAHLLDASINIESRESAKKWMTNKLGLLQDWKIIQLWLEENPVLVAAFENKLISAIKAAQKVSK